MALRNSERGDRNSERSERGGGDRNSERGGGDRNGGESDSGNRRSRRRRGGRDRGREEEQFTGDPIAVEGLLDLRPEGYGFLRVNGFLPSDDDVYVSVKQVRQYSLRKGDALKGGSRPAARNERNPAMLTVEEVNGSPAEGGAERTNFDDLTPLFPDEQLVMSRVGDATGDLTMRIVDLMAPIGKGQRGLIVSPPKAGKTTVMKQIARSIEMNNPDVEQLVLLIDERPEEVTDMARHLKASLVVGSTFDRPAEDHIAVVELAVERAKRLVEQGKDVVMIVDGITRLTRAYNTAATGSGRAMSGGLDTGAIYPPKKFFGAARNLEEGGSLTILATALVETGSRMDEVIFEEFKGTGNMELKLDRHLAERRIFPAIDVLASSTRHDELLFERKEHNGAVKLRRVLGAMADEGSPAASLEMLLERLGTFKTNAEFLAEIAKS